MFQADNFSRDTTAPNNASALRVPLVLATAITWAKRFIASISWASVDTDIFLAAAATHSNAFFILTPVRTITGMICDFKISLMNKRAEVLMGVPHGGILHRDISSIFPPLAFERRF